jgi:hypothetical protein
VIMIMMIMMMTTTTVTKNMHTQVWFYVPNMQKSDEEMVKRIKAWKRACAH